MVAVYTPEAVTLVFTDGELYLPNCAAANPFIPPAYGGFGFVFTPIPPVVVTEFGYIRFEEAGCIVGCDWGGGGATVEGAVE